MKEGYVYEGDDWAQVGEMITSPEMLAKIAAVVERTVLIVEHRHYRGASSPTRLFFEEQEEFRVLSAILRKIEPLRGACE